ncbi:MAG: carbohydrate binding family 9 domain-containing protein [Draconibacterium sp.]|nr:carbohydrate binding family 9 domain-containing protein [Draconibacterium sp.]
MGNNFTQIQPEENKPPAQQTAFKILFDDNNIYVFIRAFDNEPGKISRRISRRDHFDGDMVSINIDSYYDQQTAFSFTAMASGTKGDEAITQNGQSEDESWNPIWYLKTSIDNEGWCAEMKIPFSQLRFGKKAAHIWGIQVQRRIFRLEERSIWQFIPKGSPGEVHLYGELHGIEGIKPNRQIELMPYVVARTERFEKEEGNPFMDGKKSAFSAGLDGKVAITNDFTVDFTINPDFGQVEADPSEVNLTAFETYFSERRPFFVEGKNIYQFQPSNTIVIHNMGGDNLFYSRRIGRSPHYYPQLGDNEYAEVPEATTILGALKLSGKTKNGLSVGILESVTANEMAEIDNNGSGEKNRLSH